DAHADAVDPQADEHEAQRVGGLEGGVDVAVLRVGPLDLFLQRRLQHAEGAAVHVVDGGGEEQQGTDDPAVVPGRSVGRDVGGYGRALVGGAHRRLPGGRLAVS